jgi:predicted nucleic acid-binding protein
MPSKLPATPDCRDKFDLPFLQLAVTGKADFLVSGDQDLLSLAGVFICPIITADQFINTLDK